MPDGIQIQEASEAPQEKLEVTEARAELDKASFEAPSIVEEGDIQSAENVQEQFTALVAATADASDADGRPGTEDRVEKTVTPQAEDQPGSTAGDAPPPPPDMGAGSGIPPTGGIPGIEPNLAPENVSGESNDLDEFLEALDDELSSVRRTEAKDSTKEDPSFDGETHDPADHYSGVEMTQGEVAQDSDWNDGSSPAVRADYASDPDSSTENGTPIDLAENQERMTSSDEEDYAQDMTGATSGEVQGFATEDPDHDIKDWEDQLNTIGDDAELADIDLQGTLDKQQETIDMLAAMGEAQRDTADAVIKKTGTGLTRTAVTTETGEGGENQIVIPAGNSQIDFSGVAGEVQALDDFTWKLSVAKDEVGDFRIPSLHTAEIEPLPERTASGDHHQIPGDSTDLRLAEKEDPPAYDPNLKPEKVGEDQQESSEGARDASDDPMAMVTDVMLENYSEASQDLQDIADEVQSQTEMKNSTREEISMLQDELSDWPDDGETRDITYNEWVLDDDGTYQGVEVTEHLTKDEAKSLLAKMDNQLNSTDLLESREVTDITYQMEEGNILVGEAAFPELPSEGRQPLRDFTFDQEKYDMLKSKLAHYDGIKSKITYQINELENIYQNWSGLEVQDFEIDFAEKQSDGTYQIVTKVIPLTKISIISYIASMKATRDQVNRDAAPIRTEMMEMDPEGYAEDQERQAIESMRSNLNDEANKEAQEQEDSAKALGS